MIFVGVDWAEQHHDVCVLREDGEVLARMRISVGIEGVATIHEAVAGHVEKSSDVAIGIETDRGLLVHAMIAAGYTVFAINPKAASRYRERHVVSGAKSDRTDAKMLADLVRTDRHNHRPVAGDSDSADAVKVLARSHQSLIWSKQRALNQIRNTLLEYYPAALAAFPTLGAAESQVILSRAPTPAQGRRLTPAQIRAALQRAGRRRFLDHRVAEIHEALRTPQLEAPQLLADAFATSVTANLAVVASLDQQIARLEQALATSFEGHPDAEILRSLPGLGLVLGARMLGEFGDDPSRYADARARRRYAATAPITRASGKRAIVIARKARNRRLADACYQWAFCSLRLSPGARAYYDAQRTRQKSHFQALRAVGNRLVGIMHGCLKNRALYSEEVAWPRMVAEGAGVGAVA
jgi:Transposase/Transposase IS116/IS110/IS902 family